MRYFRPGPRETNVLVLLGCAAFGFALYLRYGVIEARPMELACAAGLPRAICQARLIAIQLYGVQAFGWVALAAAGVHFLRPNLVAFTVSTLAAILGLVLYNPDLSALAVAILVSAFARPVSARPRKPAPPGIRQTTAPASSTRSR